MTSVEKAARYKVNVGEVLQNNCGTGSGGFQPGNTCGREDGKSSQPSRRPRTRTNYLATPERSERLAELVRQQVARGATRQQAEQRANVAHWRERKREYERLHGIPRQRPQAAPAASPVARASTPTPAPQSPAPANVARPAGQTAPVPDRAPSKSAWYPGPPPVKTEDTRRAAETAAAAVAQKQENLAGVVREREAYRAETLRLQEAARVPFRERYATLQARQQQIRDKITRLNAEAAAIPQQLTEITNQSATARAAVATGRQAGLDAISARATGLESAIGRINQSSGLSGTVAAYYGQPHETTLTDKNGRTIYSPATFLPSNQVGANVNRLTSNVAQEVRGLSDSNVDRLASQFKTSFPAGASRLEKEDILVKHINGLAQQMIADVPLSTKAYAEAARVHPGNPDNASRERPATEKQRSDYRQIKSEYESHLRRFGEGGAKYNVTANLSLATSSDGKVTPGLNVQVSGGPGVSITRIFSHTDAGWSVYHSYFEVPDALQGSSYSSKFFKTMIGVYDKLDVKKISVSASLTRGGYVWARYGFVPTKASWDSVRSRFQSEISDLYRSGTSRVNNEAYNPKKETPPPVGTKISKETHDALMAACSSPDPFNFLKVIDASSNGVKIGAELMMGHGFSGEMNTKTRQYTRFKAYAART
jgi:hypothetical protein